MHFVALRVDFIYLGDSLEHKGMKKPVEIFKKLQWWLSDRFDGPFTDMGCSMEHGKQNDGISCAITTANMISHAALGEPNKCVSTKIRLGE